MPGHVNDRLTLHQLDSIEQWARVLLDEGDEEAGMQLLTLLREREELTHLVVRDTSGQLATLVRTQKALERVEASNRQLRAELDRAKGHAEKYRSENVDMKLKAESFGALLHKTEKLLAMARERITGGEVPSDLNRVAEATLQQEAQRVQLFVEKKGKAG